MTISPGTFLDKSEIEEVRGEFVRAYRRFRQGAPGRHVDRGIFVYAAVVEYWGDRKPKLGSTVWPADVVRWIRKNYPRARTVQPRDYDRWRYGALGSRFMTFKRQNVNWERLQRAFDIACRVIDYGPVDVEELLRSGLKRRHFDKILPAILCQNARLGLIESRRCSGSKKRGRAYLDALPDDSPEALSRIAETEAEIRAEIAAQDYGWLWGAAPDE